MWVYSSSAPQRPQVAAAPGGGQAGLGSPLSIWLTLISACGPSHATPAASRSTRSPNALQQIAHHLLPPLTGFEVVQFLQDRLGVVLVHPDLGHGPRRAQPDGGMRRGRRVNRRASRRRAPSTPGCGGGPPGRWRGAPPRTRPGTRHPRSASGAASAPQCRSGPRPARSSARTGAPESPARARPRSWRRGRPGSPAICGHLRPSGFWP